MIKSENIIYNDNILFRDEDTYIKLEKEIDNAIVITAIRGKS